MSHFSAPGEIAPRRRLDLQKGKVGHRPSFAVERLAATEIVGQTVQKLRTSSDKQF